MAALDEILAILLNKKVYDENTKLWHVYDSADNELTSDTGTLFRGVLGALVSWPKDTGISEWLIRFRRRGRR